MPPMTSPPEPVVDLPLWRSLKALGARLRRLAPAPPPPPVTPDPKIIPFPTGRRSCRATRPKP